MKSKHHQNEDEPFFRNHEQTAKGFPVGNERQKRNESRARKQRVAGKARTQRSVSVRVKPQLSKTVVCARADTTDRHESSIPANRCFIF